MKRAAISAAVAASLWAGAAGAAEMTYGVEVGVGNSDNIRRVPAGEESETILTAGLEYGLLRTDGRFHADVDVDLSYFDYQDDTYDSEVLGIANADLRYLFVPGRFEWSLIENFGQSAEDPFAASTPDNRENINYLTTGPDFMFRLGTAADITLFGRYSTTDYEESDFDDERLLGGLALGRELSARSELSLNVTAERVEFDDTDAGSDYDRQSAFLRYDTEGARTTVGVEAGYTEIHDDGSTSSTPLFELDVERRMTERSTLTFSGGVRSSDAASALRAGSLPGGATPGGPDEVSSTDTFEAQHASLAWAFTAQRTEFMLSAGWEQDDYDNDSTLDRDRNIYQVSARRQITPRLSLRAEAELVSSDYDNFGQDDDESRYGLFLSWNAVGRLYIEADVEYFDRDSSNALSEFEETRVFLRFAWRNTGGPPGSR
jgi:hypothetical protein